MLFLRASSPSNMRALVVTGLKWAAASSKLACLCWAVLVQGMLLRVIEKDIRGHLSQSPTPSVESCLQVLYQGLMHCFHVETTVLPMRQPGPIPASSMRRAIIIFRQTLGLCNLHTLSELPFSEQHQVSDFHLPLSVSSGIDLKPALLAPSFPPQSFLPLSLPFSSETSLCPDPSSSANVTLCVVALLPPAAPFNT